MCVCVYVCVCVRVCVCVCVCTRAPAKRGVAVGSFISNQPNEICETWYQSNDSYRCKYDVSLNFLKSLITGELYFWQQSYWYTVPLFVMLHITTPSLPVLCLQCFKKCGFSDLYIGLWAVFTQKFYLPISSGLSIIIARERATDYIVMVTISLV